MTAPTPEQMRALAHMWEIPHGTELAKQTAAALRAAADQLEAVERWLWLQNGHLPGAAIDDLSAILTADTAPQDSPTV